jgi:hypothetical protein
MSLWNLSSPYKLINYDVFVYTFLRIIWKEYESIILIGSEMNT